MTENLPQKTFNYGKEKLKIYYHVNIFNHKSKKFNACTKFVYNKHVVPYDIEIKHNKELYNLLMQYKHLFERFISFDFETKTIQKKYTVEARFMTVSKSLLSYVIQNEESLRRGMRYNVTNRNGVGTIENIDELRKEGCTVYDTKLKGERFKHRNAKLKVFFYKDQYLKFTKSELKTVKAKLKGTKMFIRGVEYEAPRDLRTKKMFYKVVTNTFNDYDRLMELLEVFFQSVNSQNEFDWNSYINMQVVKMSKYMHGGELEKIQAEYDECYKRKVKERYAD